MMIVIVNYGMGNFGSFLNMFKKIGVSVSIESDPEVIHRADKIVLPGVGAFDAAMQRINNIPGLREILDDKALKQCVPVLGICLGMQLMTVMSEEGVLPGLQWIPGQTRRFPRTNNLKVPHMGWNTVSIYNKCALTKDIDLEPRYYFVHSYYVSVSDDKYSMMKTSYGLEFDSGVCKNNIFGVQFHPEKSHKYGMKLLQNFVEI